MGAFDDLTRDVKRFADTVQRYARQNSHKIGEAADKAAHAINRRTEGRYQQKVDSVARKVKDLTAQAERRYDRRRQPPQP